MAYNLGKAVQGNHLCHPIAKLADISPVFCAQACDSYSGILAEIKSNV